MLDYSNGNAKIPLINHPISSFIPHPPSMCTIPLFLFLFFSIGDGVQREKGKVNESYYFVICEKHQHEVQDYKFHVPWGIVFWLAFGIDIYKGVCYLAISNPGYTFRNT